MTWLITFKPTFLNESLALPPKELAQVQKKLSLLAEDPRPDAKTKKQLKYWNGKLHRLRSGDYRIFYTFEEPYISVLALRRRDDDTYDEDLPAEKLGGLDTAPPRDEHAATWERWLDTPPAAERKPLPRPIDKTFLEELRIEEKWHAPLMALRSEDDLLDNVTVPEVVRTRVMDALYERPLEDVSRQPDLVLASFDDLWRYKEGELLGFLLKLNPEQEKLVDWRANAQGPTLVRGGPGTGKSTVALYRVRVLLERLRKEGVAAPRILFTTYTRALASVSEQLLASLLGEDAKLVDVRTADAVCVEIARKADLTYNFTSRAELLKLLKTAVANAAFSGNTLQVAAQRRTIEALNPGYLLEEILSVIDARGLASEEEYQAARRPGRLRTLGKTQRAAVWAVRQALRAVLAAQHKHTWEMARAQAAELAAAGRAQVQYDAVIIDEAQDLQPVALRALVHLCKSPGTLFVTADANQSIYGSGFRWTEVHEDLRFQGRTALLRANHRSTRELGEAAHDYLQAGVIEETQAAEREYVNSGPLPAVRAVADESAEVDLLAQFCRGAAKELRLGLGACAILCPFKEDGERIAEGLRKAGLEARWTTAETLDLNNPGVKVLTLKNAKGLEFPVVALAGFRSGKYPYLPVDASDDEVQESLLIERRTMFVAMTRAMRALLVVTPKDVRTPLLQGFASRYWNLGGS